MASQLTSTPLYNRNAHVRNKNIFSIDRCIAWTSLIEDISGFTDMVWDEVDREMCNHVSSHYANHASRDGAPVLLTVSKFRDMLFDVFGDEFNSFACDSDDVIDEWFSELQRAVSFVVFLDCVE